ncbi:hypothetical protein CVT25_009772 [Psilocybe cyanescens]|uniref:Uncharacterized protein n=1 Tax=Psilocybe cyanescens TaxID=93625 RepID=A0A409XQ03_PSICY|nr:hypothetical protein CVT25_009772 [Psilocybe cyanescens]
MNAAPVGFVYPSSSLAGTAPRFLGGFISMYYCFNRAVHANNWWHVFDTLSPGEAVPLHLQRLMDKEGRATRSPAMT